MNQEKPKTNIFLVPTPIGNLEDITIRAINTLKNVDLIAAEDTRHSKKLLSHYNISTPITSLHKFNEHKKVPELINKILRNENFTIAVITDAGTPGISDPGFLIVREAYKHNITVEVLPGATAFVPALILSNFPADSFVFEGFLPVKKGRQTKLKQLSEEKRTIILYESPHKLLKTLKDLEKIFGNSRKIAVCRELTKIYEEIKIDTIPEIIRYYEENPDKIKGEIVLVIDAYKK